jgi:hypothetical protein
VLARDLRHAVRALASAPAFTGVVLGILTLGLGAAVAIFSVVDATVFRRLPFDRADRIVAIGDLVKAGSREYETPQDFLDWRDRQDVFTNLAASAYAGISLKPGTRRGARDARQRPGHGGILRGPSCDTSHRSRDVTRLLASRADLHDVQLSLGPASIATTSGYLTAHGPEAGRS